MDYKEFKSIYKKESEQIDKLATKEDSDGKIILPDKDYLLVDVLYQLLWKMGVN